MRRQRLGQPCLINKYHLVPPRRLCCITGGDDYIGTDIEQQARIDLDVEEIEAAADAYDFTEAMRIYENGGNGLCGNDNDNGVGCAAGEAWGNSLAADSIRTLQGFATAGDSEMTKTGYYEETWFPIYKAYWTAHPTSYSTDGNYADGFVAGAAAAGTSVMKDAAAAELIKGGIKYQAIWMYALHKFEEAAGDCLSMSDSMLWPESDFVGLEEAWAYYAGSLVEKDAYVISSPGIMLFALAEERAADFGTYTSGGSAAQNSGALQWLDAARECPCYTCSGDPVTCEPEAWLSGVPCHFEGFRTQLTIPLVQSVLKYAWLADPANGASGDCDGAESQDAATVSDDCARSWARGWAFAAAVLPQVDNCDAAATSGAKLEFPMASRAATIPNPRRRRSLSETT